MAEDMVTVRAGWALWGKRPGALQDYSVLACSPEPFSRTDFAAIITRFAVGSPDAAAAGPTALPWVTVSWVGVDDDPQLGISITSDSGQVDGVGRPITQTAYFCVPYVQLARTPVSYCDLYDAIAPLVPSLQGDGPVIALLVRSMSPDRIADAVRRAGEKTAVAAAALLLSKPVSVIAAEGTSLRDRLEFIDAAASLLPFGYRVRFSGATWSDTGTKHRVRLAFAARAPEGAAVVHWRRTVDGPVGDRFTRIYGDRLRLLAQDPVRPLEGLGLPVLIGHLAADTAPRTFDKPQAAIDSLNQLYQPFRLLRAVRDGTGADVDDLRELFRLGRAADLRTEADVADLLAAFASQAAAPDWAQLRGELGNLRGREYRLSILAIFGSRMLWTAPANPGRAAESLRLAAELGGEDGVLAEFVRRPKEISGPSAEVRATAELLADSVLASRAAEPRYPRTFDFLAGAPILTADYVAALAGTGRAGPLLRWLDPPGGSVLSRTFRVALGIDGGLISEADLAELAARGMECVRALLLAASDAGQLDKVLWGLTHWLAGRGELSASERRFWITHLSGLGPRDTWSQALLDTALLMTDGQPTGLPPVQRQTGVDYGDDVAQIWTGLSKQYPFFDGQGCARVLAGYLDGQPWTASGAQALAVTELVTRLRGFDPGKFLATSVAARLAATPAARSWDFARDWLTWAAANEPEAVRGQLLDSLAAASPGADPGYLAGLCASACGGGIDPNEAFYPLATSGALTSAAQVQRLLQTLGPEFLAAGIDEDTTSDWCFQFSELIAVGGLGADLGQELRGLVSVRYLQDIRLELRLLAVFATDGRERQYAWTDAERQELTAIAGEIETMLKRSRKFQLPKKIRNPFVGVVGETDADEGPGRPETAPETEVGVMQGTPSRDLGLPDTVTMPQYPDQA